MMPAAVLIPATVPRYRLSTEFDSRTHGPFPLPLKMTPRSHPALFFTAFAIAVSGCSGSSDSPAPTPAPARRRRRHLPQRHRHAPAPAPSPPTGSLSFQDRCAQSGVIKCVGFDNPSDFNIGNGGTAGAYGLNYGIYPPSGTSDYTRAAMDTAVKASGAGSLRFTIPSNTGADTSGSWFTNFSTDLSTQFGENSEFFVQWRQRFSPELLTTKFTNGGGWKHVIIGTGDKPGTLFQSCTALEVVMQEADQHGFPKLYNSCTGSTSHPAYDGFVERYGSSDFKLQNGRPAPYCLFRSTRPRSSRPSATVSGTRPANGSRTRSR